MGGLIVGLVVSIFVATVIFLIGMIIRDGLYNTWAKNICLATTIILVAITVVLITIGCIQLDKNEFSKRITTFEQSKTTIEQSLKSESITGYERVSLVTKAIDENKDLISMQYDCKQWYGFNIDKNVLKLKPITFD